MELKDLKSAWDKFSSTDANRRQLGEDAIMDMLKKRTKNMIERIDRNIKIGFGFIIFLTLFFVVDDLFVTPYLTKGQQIDIPAWIIITDAISTIFILGTFLYFIYRYKQVKRGYSQSHDLRRVLEGIINILKTYRKLFNVAIAILLLVLGLSFVTGMFYGFEVAARNQGGVVQDLVVSEVASTIAVGIIILIAFTSLLIILFRWGCRRLYGNYIQKLKNTLQELDEIE
jgi:hypothetical protein